MTDTPFSFTKADLANAEDTIARYPKDSAQSAVMPLLDMAQRRAGGWLPVAAMDAVADLLGMNKTRVYEIASFYSMYRLAPVGKHVIRICVTLPCMLRGSDMLLNEIKARLNIDPGQTTKDGLFTLDTVECIGACANAPAIMIGDDLYGNLNAQSLDAILDALIAGKRPQTSHTKADKTCLNEVKTNLADLAAPCFSEVDASC
ncbi:MAG: NADH-quinone oxidoreductase subunit NuoE [Pseudomonadota bacterium]|nr:NADH-quinone oxidoreductase subunit NuoE [Pseudomonadota bacterium]